MATTSLVLELNTKADKAISDVNDLKSELNDLTGQTEKTDKSMLSMSKTSNVLATGVASVAVKAAAAEGKINNLKSGLNNLSGQAKKTDKAMLDTSKSADDLADSVEGISDSAVDAKDGVNNLESELDDLSGQAENTDKSMLSMSKTSNVLATGVTAVAAASVAAVAVIISMSRAAADYSREIQIAAQLSGEAAEKIQLMAHATATVGIGLEQLGDISKDTLEKIGQHLNDGTGGFDDFINAMKLSKKEARALANEFKDLSGPEVLQRMVSMMEDADVSAVQMSHALEGMASDTTKLIPLLANGGEKMKTLSDNMSSVIIPLTDEDIEKFIKMGEASDLAIASLTNLSRRVLVDLSESFINAAEQAAYFIAILNEGTEAQKTNRLANIKIEIDSIKESLADAETVSGRLWNSLTFNTGSEQVKLERINELIEERTRLYEDLAESRLGVGDNGKVIPNDGGDGDDNDDDDKPKDPLINPEANAAAIELLEDRFKSEEELLIQKYEREREIAAENKELLLELEEEFLENLMNLDDAADEKKREKEEKALKEKEKVDNKTLKEKVKQDKLEDKLNKDKAAKEKQQVDDSLALAMMVFGDKKEVAATVAFINTAEGVTKALASQNYAGAAITAVTGAAQISSILSADPKGGGSGSVTAPSAPPRESRSIDDIGDTSSLDFTDSTDTGSQTIRIEFANDSGDEITDAIANALNKKQKEN